MDKVFEIEPYEVFENQLQQILNNLYYTSPTTSFSSHLEADVITAAKQDLISVISECNFDVPTVLDIFHNKGWQQEKVKCFQNFMENNKAEILYAAFNHYNSSYGETVIFFDWLVKFVFGTSELKIQKYPILQLIMSTLSKSDKHDKVMYDVNKDALLKMITALENIK